MLHVVWIKKTQWCSDTFHLNVEFKNVGPSKSKIYVLQKMYLSVLIVFFIIFVINIHFSTMAGNSEQFKKRKYYLFNIYHYVNFQLGVFQ